jgi:hypothetical protein
MFTLNEEKKLTDEQLLEIIFEEFECYTHRSKEDDGFSKDDGHRAPQTVSRMRYYFNRNIEGLGDHSGKLRTGANRSKQYDSNGNVVKAASKKKAPVEIEKLNLKGTALDALLK